ncbi:putative transcription factor & chromatin remodeling CW-Zn family [Helianthus debilis subsp. tardiflorus]
MQQSRSPKITIKMGGKRPEIALPDVNSNHETSQKDQTAPDGPSVPSHTDEKETDENVILDASLSEYSTDDEDKDTDTPLCDDSQKQIVLYDHSLNVSEPVKTVKKPKSDRPMLSSKSPPEVGAFTVQCANCLKWRLIPDQEKYEVIREHITEQPFTCETTHQWNRVVSCDDPTDIEQDGTRIWAIDKPNIAQPPPGWKRLLRLRREGSSKFADVYYASPTGEKLRSLPDVVKYLKDHPEHAQGIGLARFSFQIPRPLKENYVRKRSKTGATTSPGYLEPPLVVPVQWAGPEQKMNVQLAEPLSWAGPMENQDGMPAHLKTPELDPVNRAAKKAKIYDINCL